MEKLFLHSYQTADDWGSGDIVELINMKNGEILKYWDFVEPYNWNYNTWAVLFKIVISPDVETIEEISSIESSYQVNKKILVVNPNIVVDVELRKYISSIEELAEGDIAKLKNKNLISKNEYIKHLEKKFKKAIETL